MPPTTEPVTAPSPAPAPAPARSQDLRLLALAFTAFNSLRTLAYLPTVASIIASGHSDQHSLFTWFTWFGANVTMAAWVHRHNGGHVDRVVAFNLANAVLCALTGFVIVAYRL